jgi:hypothetical protein
VASGRLSLLLTLEIALAGRAAVGCASLAPGSTNWNHQFMPDPWRTLSPICPGLGFRYTQAAGQATFPPCNRGSLPWESLPYWCKPPEALFQFEYGALC